MVFEYLQYNTLTAKKWCEIDHGHCNVTQTTTIWLEVLDVVIVLSAIKIAIFKLKNIVTTDVALALLS